MNHEKTIMFMICGALFAADAKAALSPGGVESYLVNCVSRSQCSNSDYDKDTGVHRNPSIGHNCMNACLNNMAPVLNAERSAGYAAGGILSSCANGCSKSGLPAPRNKCILDCASSANYQAAVEADWKKFDNAKKAGSMKGTDAQKAADKKAKGGCFENEIRECMAACVDKYFTPATKERIIKHISSATGEEIKETIKLRTTPKSGSYASARRLAEECSAGCWSKKAITGGAPLQAECENVRRQYFQ
ncbi:MAG: hypothetical protein LBO78_01000 [Rickettsiales bacterium]|jgi:hypothetical protein|nr:hypothetical protein [Rickettsiales bacterium]